MKKIICVLAAVLLLVFGLSACTNNSPSDGTNTPTSGTEAPSDPNKDETIMNSEILVVYFSCTNTTKR